jgi:ADP-ribosylglycohydrolase
MALTLVDKVLETINSDEQQAQVILRALGCVLGAYYGDAAGAVLEFVGKSKITL